MKLTTKTLALSLVLLATTGTLVSVLSLATADQAVAGLGTSPGKRGR